MASEKNDGFAIFGKASLVAFLLAGLGIGGNWVYNAIADVGVRECQRAVDKEIDGLNRKVAILSKELDDAKKNGEAVEKAKTIVISHKGLLAIVNQICDNGSKVDSPNTDYGLRGTFGVVCRRSGVTVDSVDYEYVRTPNKGVSDIKLVLVDGKSPVIQATTPQSQASKH